MLPDSLRAAPREWGASGPAGGFVFGGHAVRVARVRPES